jgi:hypothetical protein
MKKSLSTVALFVLLVVPRVHAQQPQPQPVDDPRAPGIWVHASAVMYTTISPLVDPGSASRWRFGDPAFGIGIGAQREFGTGLLIGVDATYAQVDYERSDLGASTLLAEGTAGIATGMLIGRYAYGGGGNIGIYLSGGLGTMAYRLEDLGSWNADFSMRAGTGIEYRMDDRKAIALEWSRGWAYHEKEDLATGDTQRPSMLRLNARIKL